MLADDHVTPAHADESQRSDLLSLFSGFQKTRVFYEKPDPPGLNWPWFKPGNCILPMLNFLNNLVLTGKNQGWFKPGGKILEPCLFW